MNKIVLGLTLGAVLGAIDGACAGFYPYIVAHDLVGIVPASMVKGLLTGAIAGWYARRSNSLGKGILVGLVAGLLLSAPLVIEPDPRAGHRLIAELVLPGMALGAIVGFATQRFGVRAPARA